MGSLASLEVLAAVIRAFPAATTMRWGEIGVAKVDVDAESLLPSTRA